MLALSQYFFSLHPKIEEKRYPALECCYKIYVCTNRNIHIKIYGEMQELKFASLCLSMPMMMMVFGFSMHLHSHWILTHLLMVKKRTEPKGRNGNFRKYLFWIIWKYEKRRQFTKLLKMKMVFLDGWSYGNPMMRRWKTATTTVEPKQLIVGSVPMHSRTKYAVECSNDYYYKPHVVEENEVSIL